MFSLLYGKEILPKQAEGGQTQISNMLIAYKNLTEDKKKIDNKNFKEKLLKKYGKIYISSMLPIQDIEFEHSKMLPCSDLCGSMALGRIFYNLLLKNGSFKCIIEGYDQYIITKAYSNHYPTLTRINNNIDEQKVVQGLAEHAPLYNILIEKELS